LSRFWDFVSPAKQYVDWASLQDDKNFEQTPAFQPFLENIGTFISGPPILYHVNFRVPFAMVSSSPVVEMATMYLPFSFDPSTFERIWDTLIESLSAAEGFQASTSGWVVEEQHNDQVDTNCMAWVGAIGWASVEAHHNAKGKHPAVQGVREAILPGTTSYHASFRKAVA
jgi:hypothetical protein